MWRRKELGGQQCGEKEAGGGSKKTKLLASSNTIK